MAWIINNWEDLAEMGMVLVSNSANDPSVRFEEWQPLQRLYLDEYQRLLSEKLRKDDENETSSH